jgi:hydroxymethylbilane synthase
MKKLKVGTRGSKLALLQTRQVIELIKKTLPEIEIEEVIVKTLGDKVQDLPLFKVGGQGLFIKAIEDALLEKRIDIAVHSLKDVPHQMSEGLDIAAYGLTVDPRDCFLSDKYDSFSGLPENSLIGTSSLRRRSQLARLRPNIRFSDFRGNLDTRMKKLEAGEVDAIIVAAAGLERYNMKDRAKEIFPVDKIVPPAGQGIIAAQCRIEDLETVKNALSAFSCKKSRIRAICERAFLIELQGGCQTPMAVHAVLDNNSESLTVYSFIGTADGSKTISRTDTGPASEPEKLGKKAAMALADAGGLKFLVKQTGEQK